MENIATGIVVYNPDIHKLRKTIIAIINQVKEVVLIDNGSPNFAVWSDIIKNEFPEIIILINKHNMGIAKALNQLCAFTYEKGFQWCFTLDQDSECSSNMIVELKKLCDEKIGIVSPNIIYKNNEHCNKKYSEKIINKKWVITSASLTNLNAWMDVGGFDELLFIDCVDRDFCYRIRQKGYIVVVNNEAELLHELGNLTCKNIFGRTIYVTNHPSVRVYYMVRNTIYLDKKFGTRIAVTKITKIIIKVLLYESDKLNKLRSIIKGIRDGIKIGKINFC